MRRRSALVIRRDDHKRDALGSIFLGAVNEDRAVFDLVSQYLGSSVKILVVELRPDFLRAEIEATAFVEESHNLVEIARDLVEKGRLRAAGEMFAEALRLNPLNPEALKVDARLRFAQGDVAGAENRWILGGELAGFDAETLRGLATAALEQGRRPTAMRYLEEAIFADPDNRAAQGLLEQLKRQIELRFSDSDSE
jgi:tetratricopeptide (TPR) repeat protein